jgi:glycosyltransferase involved in cell wall biosynthesis
MSSTNIVILRATPIAPDPRVEKIGRALRQAGYGVRALGWDRAGNLPAAESGAGFEVLRLRLKAPWGRGLANLPALVRWQAALFNWLRRERGSYQVIHACDFDTVLPALWAKRLWGKRVIYDIFDFYADMLRATPAPLQALVRRIDFGAIAAADGVLLADDGRYAQIAGSKPRHSAVIYNAPEEQAASPAPPRPPGCRLRLAYVGLLQVERGLLTLLEVLRAHPEWTLDLAGAGAEQDEILARARLMPNVIWHGRVPYTQALALNAAADALPAFYDPAIPNHRYASPNKLFEAMLLAKPVLAARDSGFDRIVLDEDCGLVMEYGRATELEAALRQLEDEALRARLGSNGRHAYDRTYGWARMAERLVKTYCEILY